MTKREAIDKLKDLIKASESRVMVPTNGNGDMERIKAEFEGCVDGMEMALKIVEDIEE